VVTSATGNCLIYDAAFDWGNTPYGSPGWDELVIYELHVGTFNDAPNSGPGSFASVAKRLGYLADLGINAVELMPSMEFGEEFT
jgi:1,4-alpha-glucan branching enzyme